METIKLRGEYIKLGQALKAAGLADTGGCEICRRRRPGSGQWPGGSPERQKAGRRRCGDLSWGDDSNCKLDVTVQDGGKTRVRTDARLVCKFAITLVFIFEVRNIP